MNLLNHHVLKQKTVAAIEAEGARVVQTVDRWAGGWPKQTKALEKEGKLLKAALEQVEIEQKAYDWYCRQYEASLSEALELHDIPLHPRDSSTI